MCPNGLPCGTCPQNNGDNNEESGFSSDGIVLDTPVQIITFRPLLVGSLEANEQPPTEEIQQQETKQRPERRPEVSRLYSDGKVDEEGYNQKERDYQMMQKACENAIKRLAIGAYSGLWLPSEKAAKLNKLYLQFKLESQNMSINGMIVKTKPSRLKSKSTSTPSRCCSMSRHRSSSRRCQQPASRHSSISRQSSTSRCSSTSSRSTSRQRPTSSQCGCSPSRPQDDL